MIIFLTVFLDMLGVTIIIPVIPALFFEADSSFFDVAVSMDRRSILYGLLIAAYPFMQFFGAPILGTLSDQYGRKPVLRWTILGSLVGYLLFGWAILNHNLPLLFVSRMIPGFMGGNISIIMSSIADVSTEESKAKNFGMVGAAFGIGFILGPTVGGILADNQIVSWFNHATPFWFTSMLTVINLLFITFAFQETLKEKRKVRISPLKGIENILSTFRIKKLRKIFTVVLFISLGFTFFTQFFSVMLIQKFEYSEKDIGFLYGWIGIWLVFTQAFIVRRLSGKVSPSKILSYAPLALAFFIALLLLPSESYWFFLINPCIALAQGMSSPNLTTVVSQQAGASNQGEIMGIMSSMNSVGQMLPPLIAGYLNTLSGNLPLMAGSFFIFLGWFIFVWKRETPENSKLQDE